MLRSRPNVLCVLLVGPREARVQEVMGAKRGPRDRRKGRGRPRSPARSELTSIDVAIVAQLAGRLCQASAAQMRLW